MFRKTKLKKIPQRSESVDIKTGIELLHEQIEEAEGLLNNRPIQSQDHENWNNTTREYLIKIYGPTSPNIETIVTAPGQRPRGWVCRMPCSSAMKHQVLRIKLI